MGFITPNYIQTYTAKTDPVLVVTLLNTDGSPVNLTGATIIAYNLMLAVVTKLPGTWTVTDATNGKASYQWTLADLGIPGTSQLYISAKLSAETGTREFDPILMVCLPTPEYIGGLIVQEVDLNINGTPNSLSNPAFVQIVSEIVGHVIVDSLPAIALAASSASIGSVTPLVAASAVSTSNPIPTTSGQVGAIAPYGSNAGATGVATDTSFKFGSGGTTTVQRVIISNESGADVRYELDAAATANSLRLKDGNVVFLAQPTAALHFYTAAAQNFNVAGGITIRGYN